MFDGNDLTFRRSLRSENGAPGLGTSRPGLTTACSVVVQSPAFLEACRAVRPLVALRDTLWFAGNRF